MPDFMGSDRDVSIIAASKPPKVAGYVTGSGGVCWSLQEWDMFPETQTAHVRIDQSPSLSLFAAGKADVADVESGAATITTFITAAKSRQKDGLRSTIYIAAASANGAHTQIMNAGLINVVDWWIADWNLNQTEAMQRLGTSNVVAVQWASPTSNPNTILPGTKLTLSQANADLSVALEGWFPVQPQATPTAVVPDVRGKRTDAAVAEIKAAGFVAGSHATVAGTVNGQTPGPGERATIGSTIDLSVAPDPAKLSVSLTLVSEDSGKTWSVG